VDRLWARGVTREKARVDLWLRDISPSDELRKWYSHDPAKWEEFQRRYREELEPKRELLKRVKTLEAEKGTVTLLFSSRETERNNATSLMKILTRS
jgi:uncharacterized protein YeaO (DUF488 family)